MSIRVGSIVRLKGQKEILTVNGIHDGFCFFLYKNYDGVILEKNAQVGSFELVPENEVRKEWERLNKIENAKVGLSSGEQFSKFVSPVVSVIAAVVVAWQTYKLDKLEEKVSLLLKKSQTEILNENNSGPIEKKIPVKKPE